MAFIYCTLSLASAVTKIPNINLIFHDFPGPKIKFHAVPGLENEIPNFHDFPVFHDLDSQFLVMFWKYRRTKIKPANQRPRLSVQSWAKEALLIRNPAAAVTVAVEAGFYLGYLRGRSFPPKMLSFPPKKYCHQYSKLYRKNHPDATKSVHTL